MGCNKVGFQTKAEATAHKIYLRKQGPHLGDRTSGKNKSKMRVYECPHCGCFHLTSLSKAVQKVRYGG